MQNAKAEKKKPMPNVTAMKANRFEILYQRRRLALTNSNIVKWLVSFCASVESLDKM